MRRAALWLGLAAAFLPAIIPGLHSGHGFPIVQHSTAAHVPHAQHPSSAHAHAAHGTHSSASASDQQGRSDDPAPAPDRPVNGACPICRTLQQIGAFVVPEVATVIARSAPGGKIVEASIVSVSSAAPYDPAQPRAPPVDA